MAVGVGLQKLRLLVLAEHLSANVLLGNTGGGVANLVTTNFVIEILITN